MCELSAWFDIWPVAVVALGQFALALHSAPASNDPVRQREDDPACAPPPERDGVTRDGVTVTRDGVTRQPAMTGAERQRKCRERKAAARIAEHAQRDETAERHAVTASPAHPSFFLSSDDHQGTLDDQEGKEKKPNALPREGGCDAASPDAGFAALSAIWPLQRRMTEAEAEYQRARRTVGETELIALAGKYLATKPDWQSCMLLRNWLHTEPWRDPVLPLASPPRLASTTTDEEVDHHNEHAARSLIGGQNGQHRAAKPAGKIGFGPDPGPIRAHRREAIAAAVARRMAD
jgi:hypothetical protein